MMDWVQHISLGYYSFSGLFNFLTSLGLAVLVYFKNPKSVTNRLCALFALAVAQWSLFYYLWLTVDDPQVAGFLLRTCMIGTIFIAPLFTDFTLRLTNTKVPRYFNTANYLISLALLLTVYTPLFAGKPRQVSVFPFWLEGGPTLSLHILHFLSNALFAMIVLFFGMRRTKGLLRHQIKYILSGILVGYAAGGSNYLLWYGIPIPPVGNILVSVYVLAIVYAIIEYRLMDISIVTIRGFVLGALLLLVLGIPSCIGLRYGREWVLPAVAAALLASAAPQLYHRVCDRIEKNLLKKQRKILDRLSRLSQSMTLIKDLERLLKAIAYMITRVLEIENAWVYVFDSKQGEYRLRACRYPSKSKAPQSFPPPAPMIKILKERGTALGYPEISRMALADSMDYKAFEKIMSTCDFQVIAPSLVEGSLLAFVALGEKSDGSTFQDEELTALSSVGAQAGLAIENAVFYEEQSRTFLIEKLRRQQEAILNSIPDMAWFKDCDSRFIVVNQSFAKVLGKTPEELAGKIDFEIWPKRIALKNIEDDRNVIQNAQSKKIEDPLIDKEGNTLWVETIKSPVFGEKNAVIGTAGIARDITDRKIAEEMMTNYLAELTRYREETAKKDIRVQELQHEIAKLCGELGRPSPYST